MGSKKERLAAIVKQKRLAKGITQTELSDSAGISLRSVQRIEKAEVFPRGYTIEVLAKALDFSIKDLEQEESPAAEKSGSARPKKIILSLGSGIIILLLAMAFLSQSRSFPENSFELFNFWTAVVLLISVTQWMIWRK
ncbi:helix-turn-helix domain-containing protein [Salinimicrobium soli]|uniref:helix-turn-helix domain-containing protein n=1 Tax=Salinimicrobium soli TaxID=1254399 RepID=UPI003AADEEC6